MNNQKPISFKSKNDINREKNGVETTWGAAAWDHFPSGLHTRPLGKNGTIYCQSNTSTKTENQTETPASISTWVPLLLLLTVAAWHFWTITKKCKLNVLWKFYCKQHMFFSVDKNSDGPYLLIVKLNLRWRKNMTKHSHKLKRNLILCYTPTVHS